MNRYEKRYAKTMKQKKELTHDMIDFLFEVIRFVVETGKLSEFQSWQTEKSLQGIAKNEGGKNG